MFSFSHLIECTLFTVLCTLSDKWYYKEFQFTNSSYISPVWKRKSKHRNFLHPKCASIYNLKLPCLSYRMVSKTLCYGKVLAWHTWTTGFTSLHYREMLKGGTRDTVRPATCKSPDNLVFSQKGESMEHLPTGKHQSNPLFGIETNSILRRS